MKYKNKIIGILLLSAAFLSLACTNQAANQTAKSGEKASTPTEAYKMLFAAVKAKDTEKIKQLMSKSSLGLAEFSGSQQKKPIEKILENGFVATTLADSLTEIRDERIKDNFGAIEVHNPKEKRWEDLPFILEDGGWKLAVGDVFQDKYKSPGKGRAQIEREAANPEMSLPSNTATISSPISEADKSVEVPKEDKPKK